jgi:hypothetical protein
VANYALGLRVIDVSNPAAPVEVGSIDTPDLACDVSVVGGLTYVADGTSGLRVVDVSDPAAPVEVGSIDTPGNARGVYTLPAEANAQTQNGAIWSLPLLTRCILEGV